LNYKTDPHAEIQLEIQEINRTLQKLSDYWKAAEASPKWKIIIYEAVIKSKLLYGLETTQLPRSCLNKLDAFQIKGLSKILGFKNTYWDRSATNQKVLEKATEVAYRKGTQKYITRNAHKNIEIFSKAYKKRRKSLMGHVIRTHEEDPFRQVSLIPGVAKPKNWGTRRSGKPRQLWTFNVLDSLWKQHRDEAPKVNSATPFRRRKYKASTRQCNYLKKWAEERKF
jgi:hypothetical protein